MLGRIFILSCAVGVVTCICMDDWVRYKGSCYYFAHLPNERRTWQQAVQACFMNESRLVIVETKDENDFIKRHLAELNPPAGDQFWTFGNDIYAEGTWNWGETPNPISSGTTFWHPGEPNQAGGEEDCLAFFANYRFDWNDEHCEKPEYYICEVEDGVSSIIG